MHETYGWSALALARACKVHPDTARRWKRAGKLPALAALLLEIRGGGELGAVDEAWRGFVLSRGQIWTPEGAGVRPGDVRALPLLVDLVGELQRERARPRQLPLFSASAPAAALAARLDDAAAGGKAVALLEPAGAGAPGAGVAAVGAGA